VLAFNWAQSERLIMANNTSIHWSSMREVGTLFGLKFLWLMHRLTGRWMVSLMLLPIVAYFLIFKPQTRRSSYQFLLAHYQYFPEYWSRKPNLKNVARHFWEFAESVVDKLMSWVVDIDPKQFVITDEAYLEALMADERGRLIIGSHFGNLESCRGFVHRYRDKVINILIHDKHSQNYNALMKQLNPESRVNIFQVSEFDIPTMLQIKNKIDAGEWMFIAGDRSPPSGAKRSVEVKFMGQTASLPIGPYMLAKALACPVELIFSYFDHSDDRQKIRVDLVPFAEKIVLERIGRDHQIQKLAQQYANALECQCAKTPYQWFNFYDFWSEGSQS
jgi:predicted LPLAT superfamily acyltransferase